MKIVINKCYGGFGLSRVAFLRLRALDHPVALSEPDIGEPWGDEPNGRTRPTWHDAFCNRIDRADPQLIAIIEELGEEVASGPHAQLKVVEIPDDVQYTIDDYDGIESIHEVHRAWD